MRALSLLKHLALAAAGLAALAAPFLPLPAHSAPLAGPVAAQVLRVIDGDTFEVEALIWVDQAITTKIRVLGIDAPESGARAHCPLEKRKGVAAKRYLASLIDGRAVRLFDIKPDKYGGRFDARVALEDGRDAGALMIEKGLAFAYDGGRKRPWCQSAAR